MKRKKKSCFVMIIFYLLSLESSSTLYVQIHGTHLDTWMNILTHSRLSELNLQLKPTTNCFCRLHWILFLQKILADGFPLFHTLVIQDWDEWFVLLCYESLNFEYIFNLPVDEKLFKLNVYQFVFTLSLDSWNEKPWTCIRTKSTY